MKLQISRKQISLFLIFLYLVATSAFQLGTGFDALFTRGSFFLMLGGVAFLYRIELAFDEHSRWIVVFWCFYFMSILWSRNTDLTISYANYALQTIGLSVCVLTFVQDLDDVMKIINILILSLLITVIRLVLLTPAYQWGTERLGEAIGLHPNTLGIRLSVCTGFAWFQLERVVRDRSVTHRKKRVAGYFCIVAVFVVIGLLSGSKKAFVAMFACIGSYEIIKSKGLAVFGKVLLTIVALAVVVSLIFTNEKLYSVLGRRVERTILTILGDATGLDVDMSLVERKFFKEQAMELWRNHPLLGYGGNGFVQHMREINYKHQAYSHCNYTELLATLGIVGFGLYYSLWIKKGCQLVNYYLKHRDDYEITKYRLTLMIALLVVIQLIMDYGYVSFTEEIAQLVLILACAIYRCLLIDESDEKI